MAKKILLADDSPTIRKVVELTFADEGIDVYSVPDGDSAMVKFVQIEPDMVIADVNMPGMSGYRLCEMIKQDDETRHIPVILLVGSFEPFDPGEASRVGCDHYFTKPFSSIRELVEKVEQCFAPGGGTLSAGHDVADIETLYASSLEPADEDISLEDDLKAFAANGEIADDNHFDDGESLDHFLSESRREMVAESPQIEKSAVEPSHAEQPEADDAQHETIPADPPRAYYAERYEEPNIPDESAEEDVLGIGGAFQPQSAVTGEFLLDVERSQPPDEPSEDSQLHLTAVPPSRDRTTGDLGPSPWEQAVSDPVIEDDEPYMETVSATPATDVLGDASMDDEIIETSHPYAPAAPVEDRAPATYGGQSLAAKDPFSERVAISEDAGTNDDELAFYRSRAGDSTPIDEVADETPANTEPQSVSQPLGAHVTPELIESIVASVLEKMSDRAVRAAAQEAVPRIAEKLIREALTDEDGEPAKDAAKG